MVDPISTSALLGEAAPLVSEVLKNAVPTIQGGAGRIAKNLIDKTIANLQIGFGPYLQGSYNKCKLVKTLLSQDRPLDLLEIYVNVFLQCGDTVLEDGDLINNLQNYQHVIVTGLAGSGKSMFMRYLTISMFERPFGKIPIFVELRQLNSITSKKLLTFIYKVCTSADNKVTFKQFELALMSGSLVLILDGFDEIDFSERELITEQILEISNKYPNATIVMSSRPDSKFASWQDFHTFTVRSLSKDQVVDLLQKINYDAGLKKRFIREVKRHLYDSHRSFLSSPLLCSIMLLTYEQFAEIPNKMHIFYDQAFSALFRRHDAQKAQFIRKSHADLPLDDFREFFAAFCAFSYLEEHFSFPEEMLEKLTAKALEYVGLTCNVNDVISDLYECVCMLQKEGLDAIFVHRSFQEYFSAVFIKNYHGSEVRAIIDRFSQRGNDQVIPMLFEMARTKVDVEWTIPHIDDLIGDLDDPINAKSAALYFRRQVKSTDLQFRNSKQGISVESPRGKFGDSYYFTEIAKDLYFDTRTGDISREDFISKSNVLKLMVRDILEKGCQDCIKEMRIKSGSNLREICKSLGITRLTKSKYRSAREKQDSSIIGCIEIAMTPELIECIGGVKFIASDVRAFQDLKRSLINRTKTQDSLVSALFNEKTRGTTRRISKRIKH